MAVETDGKDTSVRGADYKDSLLYVPADWRKNCGRNTWTENRPSHSLRGSTHGVKGGFASRLTTTRFRRRYTHLVRLRLLQMQRSGEERAGFWWHGIRYREKIFCGKKSLWRRRQSIVPFGMKLSGSGM